MDIAELGIQVTSAPAVKGAADLDKLTVAAAKAEDQVQDLAASSARLGPALGGVSKAAGGLSGNARMLAQQLSQVGQMTMVTGNFAQALAVQLPDIGLAFGAIGAAAGLVAGVALPMVIAAFGGTSDAANRVREALEASEDAVTSYVKAAEAAIQPNERLIESYGRLSGAATVALSAIADAGRVEAINSVTASIKSMTESLLEWDVVGQQAGHAVYGQVLADSFGMAADEAARVQAAVIALGNARGVDGQANAARSLAAELLRAYGVVDAMPAPIRQVYVDLNKVVLQAGGVQGAMEKSTTWTKALAGAAGFLPGIFDQAAGAARGIAGALQSALDKAYAFRTLQQGLADGGKVYSGRGGDPRTSNQQGYGRFVYDGPALDANNMPIAAGAGGGGGGSLADDFAARLEGLQQGLQTERETIDTWYADAQAILADRRAQEILGEKAHRDMILEVERSYQDQLAALQAESQQRRLSDMGNFFGALAGIASAGGKGMVKAVATFSAIQGTISAYAAAIEALRTPNLSIWGRFAAYASVLAAGLKGVAAIRAAGGVGGGAGGAAAQAPAAQAVQTETQNKQTLFVQGIRASDIFTGQMIYDMFMGEGRLRGAPVVQLMR